MVLNITINEGDDEAVVAGAKEKALAEHIAAHPEDAGRTVKDFFWIVHEIVAWPREQNGNGHTNGDGDGG
jgi:hypothetical protein